MISAIAGDMISSPYEALVHHRLSRFRGLRNRSEKCHLFRRRCGHHGLHRRRYCPGFLQSHAGGYRAAGQAEPARRPAGGTGSVQRKIRLPLLIKDGRSTHLTTLLKCSEYAWNRWFKNNLLSSQLLVLKLFISSAATQPGVDITG